MWKRRFWKWFNYGLVVVFFAGGITPSVLNTPVLWRPWIFLLSIAWFFLITTGAVAS
jgi:hypothetical protein